MRIPSGRHRRCRTLGSATVEIPLQSGDVIHAVNGISVSTLDDLRGVLGVQKPGDAVVLQVERYGQLIYVSFLL